VLVSGFLEGGILSAEVPLTSALAVRSLSAEEAAKKLPVQIRGTVVFVEGPSGAALIQDETAGTYIHRSHAIELRAGDVVSVSGVTMPGMYLPGVENAFCQKLGHGEPPRGISASYADLLSGRYHYQLVVVEGVVQAVRPAGEEGRTLLTIAMGQDLLEVRVYAPPKEGLSLIDSRVHIEGLAAGSINNRRQLVQPSVWLQDWNELKVLEPAPEEGEVPLISGSNLLGFQVGGQAGHRVRVAGTVLAEFPDGSVFIREGATSIEVQLVPSPSLPPGTWIEVVGFPMMRRFSASLSHANLLRSVPGEEAHAIESSVKGLLNGTRDNDLVSVMGSVSGCFRTEDGHLILLQDQGRMINVRVPVLEQEPPSGSRVRVTGICVVESSSISGVKSLPSAVSIRCRTHGDVKILSSPSWWTVSRIASVAMVLVFALAGSTFCIVVLRRRIRRQTAFIRRQAKQEAAQEERLRIARDFHDTLEQGLAGLSLRLGAVQARGMDEKSEKLMQASLGLVSQIQTETRSLVCELREPSHERVDLVAALREITTQDSVTCQPTCEMDAYPFTVFLPSSTVHQLRMISREAVTNAMKHAEAQKIRVALEFNESRLRISISDDGKGCDPGVLRGGKSGHFGCVGIEERCLKIGARVQWHSAPGKGTSIEIEMVVNESAAGK